jgi:hypothetical protein
MPIELADSGNSTGVDLLVVAGGVGLVATGCVGLLATGGVGCERSHPQTATTATQTTTDLKRCMLAQWLKID